MNPMLAAKAFFETPAALVTPRMERDFFSSIVTRNKTYKTTFHQRFADINPHLVQWLKATSQQSIRVLDVAVSSGVSTVELYDDLLAGGLAATIVATDLFIDAILVRVLPKCHVLVDQDGYPLRFDLPFGTIKPWVVRSDYRNGFFVVRKAINTWFTRRARRILLRPADKKITLVKLVSPRLLANEHIVVCQDDICKYNSDFSGRFGFIRAANILNKGYFEPDVLASMIENIGNYLKKPGGLLLVVRTHEDDSNHGTLFRLDSNRRFETVQQFGGGSEIEDIVLKAAIPVR